MFGSVNVIGRGRVGAALAERLGQRGVALREDAELILLCVPDAAIATTARDLAPGPWVAHVSGATSLRALERHARRFGMHPLQTFTRTRGAEQLDGTGQLVENRAEGWQSTLRRRAPLHQYPCLINPARRFHMSSACRPKTGKV